MKTTTFQALPTAVGGSLIYQCAGPTQSGVCFRLRLPYLDETRQGATTERFDHEWVVSRQELDEAEERNCSDQVLLARREREAREFLLGVEAALRKQGLRIERVGRDLVMRRVEI